MHQRRSWITVMAMLFSAYAVGASAAQPVTMVTGPKTGTYYAVGGDIARISTKEEGQPVTVLTSNGSVDNLQKMTDSPAKVGVGVVQSDVLGFLLRSENPRSKQVANNLRLIFPLYSEEVHVLARDPIRSLRDLHGKRVVVGQAGSGNMLTAINLFSLLGIQPQEKIQLAPPEGVVAVLANEADAVIFTGGKPVTLFKNLEDVQQGENARLMRQVHFVPITDPAILKEYEQAVLTSEDYSFITDPIPTIAVRAALISNQLAVTDKTLAAERCEQLDHIGRAIRMHKAELIKMGHPKWKEVDPYRSLAMWKRDECAWKHEDAERAAMRSASQTALERDLLSVIERPRQKQ